MMRPDFITHHTIYLVFALFSISVFSLSLENRQSSIKAVDPFDQTWILQWAALGDSYGVGLGAGPSMQPSDNVELNPGGLVKGYCYQYTDGYPNVLHEEDLGVQPNRKFQYLGCSGATASSILTDQVPLLKSPQMVTLSAGGNDAGLAAILNKCIYQWNDLLFTKGCDSVLDDTTNTINSDGFTKDLEDLIEGIKSKMDDGSNRIYWVGYSKFFDTSTRDCDNVTWGVLRPYGYQYLTLERRQRMNDLVDLVNEKITAVISKAGPQVVFVDWDADAQFIKGKYCEPGVDESFSHLTQIGASQDREQTVFYEWGTTKDDPSPDDPKDELRKRQMISGNTTAGNASFEGAIANYVKEGQAANPDAYKGLDFQAEGSLLPDKYGRCFHPTIYGNAIVARKVIDAMIQEQAKLMNQPAITTTITAPYNAAAATIAPIQCHGISGNNWIVSRDVAAQNAADFCKQSNNSVEYNQGSENDLRLSLSSGNNTTKAVSDAPDCVGNFVSTVIDGCDANDPINNPHDYKFGGNFTTSDGWVFKVEPLAFQADQDDCWAQYFVLFDEFKIWGKNLPDAKLGKDGAGLLTQLKGCGDVTDWSFDPSPAPKDGVAYQWYAHGRLPIGTKACVGRALQSAGGSSPGGCKGPG